MLNNRKKSTTLLILTALLILFSVPVLPCDVPVFRYALERWPADAYEVIIFHRGPLSPEGTSVVEWLKGFSADALTHANFIVQTVDLSSSVLPPLLDLWETLDNPELPCLVVRYPGSFPYRGSIWNGRLTMDTAKTLVDSPARQDIARKIIDGESAVWILLESGDQSNDDTAADMLKSQLTVMEETLRLPRLIPGYGEVTSENDTTELDSKISFSLLRIPRNDPAESIFIAMLMYSEPDLFEYTSHPMAFPVLGRGRALYALVGEGITERNIHMTCEFITGACSCEAKALNPGVDILIAADWERAITDSWIQYVEMPPLVGLSELVEVANSPDSSVVLSDSSDDIAVTADTDSHSEPAIREEHKDASLSGESEIVESTGHLFRNIMLALGVIIAVTAILTLKVGGQKKRN